MPEATRADSRLPRPFDEDDWPKALTPAAQALWLWHAHLFEPALPETDIRDLAGFFREERARAAAGQALRVMPPEVAEAAYAACRAHGLSLDLLAAQVKASTHLAKAVRFPTYAALDAFLRQWSMAHGRLLARLAGLDGAWQLGQADELARAFFLTRCLADLPGDLARDRLFLPLDEAKQAGVTLEQLRAGIVDEAMRKLLWKQAVRARDAYAQGKPLVQDLRGSMRRAFKRWWLGGLEVLAEIERRGFDVWSAPVAISGVQRFRVCLQALVGRTAFR